MIDFRVSGDGHDTQNVTASPRDILRWEAAFQGASLAHLLGQFRLTEIYQLAWVTCKEQKHPLGELSFKDFLDKADVRPGHSEDAPASDDVDPTQPGA